jgi:phosphatidylglycerol:prolipoprotein diacylglycerol transferase
MLYYPDINPVLISITDTLQIRWYGLLYLASFAGCWFICRAKSKHLEGWQNKERLSDLFFFMFWGVILGGRIGYMLFYGWQEWLGDPLLVFKTWHGGMSFHGGLIGVILSITYFCRINKLSILFVGDMIAPSVPLALGLGRLGNFINGELWGNVTNMPWGMVFAHVDNLPRHPSQLYAILLEGLLLFSILWIYTRRPRKLGQVSGLFLISYAFIRGFEELFRQPDPQYGYLAWNWLTMGQVLCVPMFIFGLWLFKRNRCKPT